MAYSTSRTATVTAVPMTGSSASLTAALGAGAAPIRYISNTSGQILYVRFGTAAASTTDYTLQLAAGQVWESPSPFYAGPMQGILATGSGNVNVTAY